MIIINMEDFSWGTAEVPDYANGRRLNFLDPESKLRFTMIFGGDPLKMLIEELIPALSPAQAEALIGHLQLQTQADPALFATTDPASGEEVVDGTIASEEEQPS